jgi:hypothetical protein
MFASQPRQTVQPRRNLDSFGVWLPAAQPVAHGRPGLSEDQDS